VGDATIAPVTSLDMTRQLADVTFENATGERVLTAPGGAAAVRRGLETGAALLASDQVGVAQWCLATTVGYLKERRQFGRVVRSFHALKHRLGHLVALARAARAC